MRGFTLIEVVVVIGIISVLSLLSINTIVEFQKNSILKNTGQEFVSTLKIAKSKSMAGEILPGETDETFDNNGLPEYGVRVIDNSYILFRKYIFNGVETSQNLETFAIDASLILTPNSEVVFNRQAGFASSASFNLKRINGFSAKVIDISEEGLITIKDI